MLSSGNADQADAEHPSANTGQQSRSFDRRILLAERRQNILQQKQTDSLPKITVEPSNARVAWRQVAVLREENRRLHAELGILRVETQRVVAEYNALQAQFDKEVATVNSGNAQDLEFYQNHLNELQAEHNRLQEANAQLERRYQELYSSFHEAVDEEARRMVQNAARTLELPSEEPPILLQDVVKTIELHAQEVEDSQLVEVLHLKGEVQRMSDLLEQERKQIEEERQQLLIMRQSVREQAQLRYKTVQARLHLRWKTTYIFVIAVILVLLIGLQYLALWLFKVPAIQSAMFVLLMPLVVCLLVGGILVNVLSTIRHMYLSAPHKVKVKKETPKG